MDAWYWQNRAFEGTGICQGIDLAVALDSYMGRYFLYGDLVLEPSNVVYYGRNEEYAQVGVLGAWVLDVIVTVAYKQLRPKIILKIDNNKIWEL